MRCPATGGSEQARATKLTGWQRHSVRGFLSAGGRKQGYKRPSFPRAGARASGNMPPPHGGSVFTQETCHDLLRDHDQIG